MWIQIKEQLQASKGKLYLELHVLLRAKILSGILMPGEKLPPVRKIAMLAGVATNIALRALRELLKENLIVHCGTTGYFVVSDYGLIESYRQEYAAQLT